MPFLTKASLEIVENPHSLVFRIERERGWVESLMGFAAILFFFWEAQNSRSKIWVIFGLIAIAGIIANWLHGTKMELTVTNDEILARGNVNRMFRTEIVISSAVKSIDYLSGGEDAPSGLYVKQAWQNTCVVADITEEQTGQITDRIYRKFSEIGSGDTESGSVLFGARSEPTTLGLTRVE